MSTKAMTIRTSFDISLGLLGGVGELILFQCADSARHQIRTTLVKWMTSARRFRPSQIPRPAPCTSIASRMYCEQVG